MCLERRTRLQEHLLRAWHDLPLCVKSQLTPFFPGMAHSQFIKFMVPSGFLVGTATKPWDVNMNKKVSESRSKKLGMSKDDHGGAYKGMVFSPGFTLLGQSAKSDARHCCSSTPPCGTKSTAHMKYWLSDEHRPITWLKLFRWKILLHFQKMRDIPYIDIAVIMGQ